MLFNSSLLGDIEVNEEDIYTFPAGIPGFESFHRFVMFQPDAQIPFFYLQSVEDHELALLVADPFVFYPEYNVELPQSVQEELLIKSEEDVRVLTIVSIQEKFADSTMNLFAPLVVNMKDKLGKQTILHQSDYSTRHKLAAAQAEGTGV